jgi:hypothetical protein
MAVLPLPLGFVVSAASSARAISLGAVHVDGTPSAVIADSDTDTIYVAVTANQPPPPTSSATVTTLPPSASIKIIGTESLGSLDPIGGFAVDSATDTLLVGGVNSSDVDMVAIVNSRSKTVRDMRVRLGYGWIAVDPATDRLPGREWRRPGDLGRYNRSDTVRFCSLRTPVPLARPPDYDQSSARRDHQASAAVIAPSASRMPSPTSPAVAAQCRGTRARAPGSHRYSSRVNGSGAVLS